MFFYHVFDFSISHNFLYAESAVHINHVLCLYCLGSFPRCFNITIELISAIINKGCTTTRPDNE